MSRIHPTAIIDPRARLHESVEVGAYSIIGADVEIGEGSWIASHALLRGPMTIGKRNRIYSFTSIGEVSQDKSVKPDDPTSTIIGDDNVIREYVSIQRGTMKEYETKRGITRVGSNNWLMNYCHIAHDCVVGDNCVFANGTTFAGHVEAGDWVTTAGGTLVSQFCRFGAHVFAAGPTILIGDAVPFVIVQGVPSAGPRGVNKIGLARRGFKAEDIEAIEAAYRLIYRSGKLMAEVKQELAAMAKTSVPVQQMLDFINTAKRPLARG